MKNRNGKKALNLRTGAKIAATVTTLVAAFMLTPTVANAEVPSDCIIGDLETTEDRTRTKIADSKEIIYLFDGFDRYGNQTITMDEIEKAIELSDILSNFFNDPVEYTNTKPSEVTNLDINSIYNYYLEVRDSSNPEDMYYFCINNLPNKPAIDAYITFSYGTVSNNIKKNLATQVEQIFTDLGYKITAESEVVCKKDEMYILVETNGRLQKVILSGDGYQELRDTCYSLDTTYQKAICNIAGTKKEHDDSFMYNGIDTISNESAWLSLPDDIKKSMLNGAILINDKLASLEYYEYDLDYPTNKKYLTRKEKDELRDMGYDKDEVTRAIKKDLTLKKVVNKNLTKTN